MRLSLKIPEEILMEILVRLPANSLIRFKCVSKLWSSLISSRYFTNLYFKFSSSTKRKRVFVYTYDDNMLFSRSVNNSKTTSSLLQLNPDLTLSGIENRLHFVNSLRGLICFRIGRQIQIINFTTRQVLNLPLVESNMFSESDFSFSSMSGIYSSMWNYFGYDSVNDEYKVLSIIKSKARIFVLGAGTSWRETKTRNSPPPSHTPFGRGITINSVLYYIAWSHENICVLMSFDFNSEEFNLIEFPKEVHIKWDEFLCLLNLINYQGQLALLDWSNLNTDFSLDLWVIEDAKWSHKSLVLPYHQLKLSFELESYDLVIRSTSSGDVTLSGVNKDKRSVHVFYDLEKNCITRGFFIELPYPNFGFLDTSLWDDVESIMFLEA